MASKYPALIVINIIKLPQSPKIEPNCIRTFQPSTQKWERYFVAQNCAPNSRVDSVKEFKTHNFWRRQPGKVKNGWRDERADKACT